MMIIGKFPGGTSGAKLRVIAVASAAALPASEREYTVAIVSSVTVGLVYAQAKAPNTPQAGDVWLRLGLDSNAPVPMNKDDTIRLSITHGMQYDADNGWLSRETYIRVDSVWVDLYTWLYANGDKCTLLTGGWVAGYGTGYFVDAANYIRLRTDTTTYKSATAVTNNVVDLTPYATLKCSFTILDATTLKVAIGYGASKTTNLSAATTKIMQTFATTDVGDHVISMDISAADTSAYVMAAVFTTGAIDIKGIWMEM